ncbi:glycosyltransferase family 4 protein [Haloimpatiens sp. FM7330]|uniref:glycosyltransferase family 4 protein n=1 Tax=Haloimpatiens sp. FM7330 TaxID=3298610 RepID=UPI00363CD7A0
MRYCVLYPNTRNVNLIKDMGMIPYKLHELYGYDAYVACYKLGEYEYLKNEVKGLKVEFIDKKFNSYTLDGIRYLKREAKNIDILQIFHVTMYSMFYALKYKKLNPKGKIYLKLDCSHKLVEKIYSLNGIQKKFLNMYLDKVDLISAEQRVLCEKLKTLLPNQKQKIINIPDGVDYESLHQKALKYDYNIKDNIILNVARVGAAEKNTPMLLEAFKNIKNIEKSGWKLVIVGPIKDGFQDYIDKFFKKNHNLKNIIEFKGAVHDRKELFEQYSKSKIFCLTSEFESFGIAFVEAAALGNVIVSTDVGISRELVQNNNGMIVNVNDTKALTHELEKFINNKNLEKYSRETYNLCKKNFNWDEIIHKLNVSLKALY